MNQLEQLQRAEELFALLEQHGLRTSTTSSGMTIVDDKGAYLVQRVLSVDEALGWMRAYDMVMMGRLKRNA